MRGLGVAGVVALAALVFVLMPFSTQASTACTSISGNLVANCGFENGVYTSGSNGNVPVDWTSNAAFDGEPGFNQVTSFNPNNGSYELSIGNLDSEPLAGIGQTITDVSGATYTESFWVYDGGANGDGNAFFDALVNGSSKKLLNDTVSNWTGYSFTFTGTGSDNISFSAQTNPAEWHLDDVSVTGSVVPAPEPSTLLLFGAGVFGVAFLRKRMA